MAIPEQYFNDPGTALGAAISSSGATTITVTSSTGYGSGAVNFRIGIDLELLLVTNISGTTWTVTRGIEGTTATTHTNGTAVEALLTAASLAKITKTFVPVYPAAAASWTLVRGAGGASAKSDNGNTVVLSTAAGVAGIMEALVQAVPSTPYTKTLKLSALALGAYPLGGSDVARFGVVLTDGNTNAAKVQFLHFFLYEGAGTGFVLGMQLTHHTNFAFAGTGSDAIATMIFSPDPNSLFFQIADDGTNRTFALSTDGSLWITIFTEASASPFTPTHYGFAAGFQGSAGNPWALSCVSDN